MCGCFENGIANECVDVLQNTTEMEQENNE